MSEPDVLVSITASREKDKIVYRVDCSNEIANEELEHYLKEMIKGICKWKPGVCHDKTRSLRGVVKEKRKKSS